ncbi:hypothetical protein KIPB_002791 [Kipferlia bialata]|uniref:Uncharacterized protein n=1 Tax=Kipferlia bialata TaxID=797122 RepID=A0A9K3GGH6_9EUKA|nr:hypothetical protein KIPB_002791 [Kipferlia bialata]|eukprot:g2791.t1
MSPVLSTCYLVTTPCADRELPAWHRFTSATEPLPANVVIDMGQKISLIRLGIFLHGESNQNPARVRYEVSVEAPEDEGFEWVTLVDTPLPQTARYVRYTIVSNYGGSGDRDLHHTEVHGGKPYRCGVALSGGKNSLSGTGRGRRLTTCPQCFGTTEELAAHMPLHRFRCTHTQCSDRESFLTLAEEALFHMNQAHEHFCLTGTPDYPERLPGSPNEQGTERESQTEEALHIPEDSIAPLSNVSVIGGLAVSSGARSPVLPTDINIQEAIVRPVVGAPKVEDGTLPEREGVTAPSTGTPSDSESSLSKDWPSC